MGINILERLDALCSGSRFQAGNKGATAFLINHTAITGKRIHDTESKERRGLKESIAYNSSTPEG